MNEFTDKELVTAYLEGSQTALEILIQRHLNGVLSFVATYTKNQASAEDVTQETFVKVWKQLKKHDPDYSFKTWLYTIAKHSALDHLKKRTELSFSQFESIGTETNFQVLYNEAPTDILETLELQDRERTINHAINKLSDKYQNTVKLHYQQDLSFREIADTLATPLNTIKTHHRRALAGLKEFLGPSEPN